MTTMTMPPRFIQQPGPVQEGRIVAVAGRGRSFALDLTPGVSLLETVQRGFAAEGFTSGVVEMADVALGPFGYVMPALSKDGANAAFYSDIVRPAGVTVVERAALTFGSREGAPFFHCHGLWREADGEKSGGHMLPDETFIAAPGQVTVQVKSRATALGLSGVAFVAMPDPEINFTVFGPVASDAPAAGDVRVVAMRPRPNQDFHAAILSLCRAHGIARARIRGGVGSTIGCVFEDGRVTAAFATEVYIAQGSVEGDLVTLDVGMIDYTGAWATGRLKAGANPVLMTFELVIEAL